MTIQVFLNTMRMANETVSFTTEGDSIGIAAKQASCFMDGLVLFNYVRMETI